MTPALQLIDCPALHERSPNYPARFSNRVPKTIYMLEAVRISHAIQLTDPTCRGVVAHQGQTYPAWTNSHGAVAAVMPDGRKIGVKPDDFQVVEWHQSSALQLCRTTILLLLQTVSSEPLLAQLNRAVEAIEVRDNDAPTIVLRALKHAQICVNDTVLQSEIRRAIDALGDEMKGVRELLQ